MSPLRAFSTSSISCNLVTSTLSSALGTRILGTTLAALAIAVTHTLSMVSYAMVIVVSVFRTVADVFAAVHAVFYLVPFAAVMLGVLSLVWGYSWVTNKIGILYSSPFDFAAMRVVVGAVGMFMLMLIQGRSLRFRHGKFNTLIGLLQTSGFSYLLRGRCCMQAPEKHRCWFSSCRFGRCFSPGFFSVSAFKAGNGSPWLSPSRDWC